LHNIETANFLSLYFGKPKAQTLQVLTLPTKVDRQRQPEQFVVHNLKGKEELVIRLWWRQRGMLWTWDHSTLFFPTVLHLCAEAVQAGYL